MDHLLTFEQLVDKSDLDLTFEVFSASADSTLNKLLIELPTSKYGLFAYLYISSGEGAPWVCIGKLDNYTQSHTVQETWFKGLSIPNGSSFGIKFKESGVYKIAMWWQE